MFRPLISHYERGDFRMSIIKTGPIPTLTLAMLVAAAVPAWAQDGASAPAASTAAPMAGSGAPASSKAADRALRRRVLEALAKAKGLRASGITVRAHNGAVTLEGWVPEAAQIDQAARVAQDVPGVASVANTLTLSTF
jgi:hyperosmotically inducible periplasmic protein